MKAGKRKDFIKVAHLPDHGSTDYPSYGAGHIRPLLALSRPVGNFEVDLNTFKKGMPDLKTIRHRCLGDEYDI
jgi:hypothetical protein